MRIAIASKNQLVASWPAQFFNRLITWGMGENMTCENIFTTLGVLCFGAAVITGIAMFYYFRSLRQWHEHCLDWSNFLQRTHANFYDTHKTKGEEIAGKI